MSRQDGYPPRCTRSAAYTWVRFAWLAAAVLFVEVTVLAGLAGAYWVEGTGSFLLGFTVTAGRRSLRRFRGRR